MKSGGESAIVRPVTGFPAEHALVKRYSCYSVGDPIPHEGIDSQCQTSVGSNFVNSAQAFYSPGKPTGASSNIGFEEHDATTLFFVVDDQGKGMLVINIDKPGSPSINTGRGSWPRYAQLEMNSTSLAGKGGISTLIRDDGSEFGTWDTAAGRLNSVRWKWADCCTDGGALGYLPSSGFCLDLTWERLDGIDKIRIGSYNGLDSTMSFTDVERQSYSEKNEIQACAKLCSDVCEGYQAESDCNSQFACQWCNGNCMTDSDEDGVGDECDSCPYDSTCQ